ncbi:MAG: ribosome maturation factor RimP, partial [Proteobacteria bacterium]|nr:ribosome maturation factor RimP [Pseudomonadota bacterium]
MNELKGKQAIEERARELAEPIIAAEGLELVDIEYVRERDGWVLRMFIDKDGGGVGLDD